MRTFLNLTAFTPQMPFGLCALLQRLGGSDEESRVQGWLAPPVLFPNGQMPDDAGYRYAVDVAEHLGMVERRNGRLSLSHDAPPTLEAYRTLLRERIMERIAASFDGGDDPTHELGRALAWWMSQD